ncbi:NACHT domain-containing protein [Spirosoma rigui]|uniref:NACHT domain-containing protein n=1 Tax=Spirosoma rigui TaxID=564064 RepID=UPI0009B11D71|nr:NACHT domain-containing protein [Spirosoma rigui]
MKKNSTSPQSDNHTQLNNMIPLLAVSSKPLIDTFITPKLEDLNRSMSSYFKTHKHDYWENQFSEYIKRTYTKYSNINTIAFNNQQRQLKDLYIPLTIEDSEGLRKITIEEYNDDFLPTYERVLITDTAGMGKSTLIKRLFLSIVEHNKGIPIIIELRRINKEKTILDEIIDQLSPINENINKNFVLDLIARGDFIFFFDGFDEISIDDRSVVTADITDFVNKASANSFVITSRPEPALTAFGDFKTFSIHPLSLDEAYDLLRKYNNNGPISDLLINKISEDLANVYEFLTNPLLVSLLYTAFEHKQTIPFKKHIFYRQVFDALFELHDLSKGDSFNRAKIRKCQNLSIEEFHQILRAIGFLGLQQKLKTEYTKDEIIDIIRKAKSFCTGLDFKESEFLSDITSAAPLFAIDGIYYKWAHKSLMEYFIAQFIYLDSKDRKEKLLLNFYSDELEKYLNTLDLYKSIDPKGFRDVIIMKFLDEYVTYCENTYTGVKIPIGDINIRRAILFQYDIVLIKYKISDYGENGARELFKCTLEARNKIRLGWSISSKSYKSGDEALKVVFSRNKNQHLLRFLLTFSDYVLFEDVNSVPYNDIILNIPVGKAYVLNDEKKSIFNTKTNFSKINNLLLSVISDGYLIISKEKAKLFIEEIKREQERESSFFQ